MANFAKRMDNIKASDIRQLLKIIGQPGIISFAGGLPAPELFPVEDFKAALDAMMEENGRVAMQYGATEGWAPLRKQIVERLEKKNNIHTDPAHILLTAGSQQGLDFMGKLFLDPGDVVVVESPSYLGAINAFKQYECSFVEVPTDENGMIMSELDRILATTENVKLIYVIPDFQNPSGRTWPWSAATPSSTSSTSTASPPSRIIPTAICASRGSISPRSRAWTPRRTSSISAPSRRSWPRACASAGPSPTPPSPRSWA